MINKNGFSSPLHPFQILSWVIFLFHTIIPALLVAPNLSEHISIFFLVLFYLSHFCVFLFGYLATRSIPTIKVYKEPIYLETMEDFNYFCTICQSYVSKTSKHCGSCDRCVDNFDHHCKWLNNCIGQKNYRLFITLILSLEISEIILFGVEIKVLTRIIDDTILSFIVFDTIINGIVILFVGYLIFIHAWLKVKGMTTYEYIRAARKKYDQKVIPSVPADWIENKNFERKSLTLNWEVKKSIIKGSLNRTVGEGPCSFSIPRQSMGGGTHNTVQLKFEFESSNIII